MSEIRRIRNLVWGIAAIALAMAAQRALRNHLTADAVILYLAAILFIVYALRRQPGPVVSTAPISPYYSGLLRRWGWLAGTASGMLTALALRQFASPMPSPSAWWLYLGGMAFFVLAAGLLDVNQPAPHENQPPWTRRELTTLVLIFAMAAFMRLYRFGDLPFGTWYDEADNGLEALRILNDPHYRPVYVPAINSVGHYLYLIAFSFRLLGVTTQAIRAVSVAMGLATVAAAYLVGRELFNRRMGLVLAFLLAVSRWDVNFSRIGMYNVSTPLFELLTIGFLLRGLRRGRYTDFAWAGLALGLGMCFYTAFRVFPLVVGVFLAHQALAERGFLCRSWPGLLVFALATLITIAPVAEYAVLHPKEFWARTRTTSIFAGKTRAEGWQAVRESARKHLLMFHYRGDPNGRHNLPGEPMLDPATGALMALGLGVSLWRARRPASLMLPVWLLSMLAPAIFSLDFEAPQSLRGIGSLPAVYLLAVVPLDGLWRAWERGLGQRYTGHFVWPLLLLLAQIGYANYHVYFHRQANDFASWNAFSTAETLTGRLLAELGDQADFYVISLYYNHPTVRFLARNAGPYHRFETDDTLPLQRPATRDVILVLDPERQTVYRDAQRFYPNASFQEYQPPFGGPTVLYVVRLTPADIAGIQGLEANYYLGRNWSGEPALTRRDLTLQFNWRDGDPLPLPFSVEWQGVLRATRYGSYRLVLQAPGWTELYLDETLLLQGQGKLSAEVTMAQGNHALRLRAVGAEGYFELAWQPPGEEMQTVPTWALYRPPVTNNGLLGKYYPNSEWRPPVALARIDSRLNMYFHVTPLPRPYTVEWEGKLFVPQSGRYLFGLESIDESVLYIDGQQVTAGLIPNQYQEGEIDLQAGLHEIRVRFSDRTNHTHINLYWTPPGGVRQIVPAEVLFPPQGSYQRVALPTLAELQALPKAEGIGQPAPSTASERAPARPPTAPEVNVRLLWAVGSCGTGLGQFQSPAGLAVDGQGNLYLADVGNHRVVKLNAEGQVLLSFGRRGERKGQFLEPFDVVVEPDGNVVVLDAAAQRLQRFSSDGQFLAVFGEELAMYRPRGLGVDTSGKLYVADTGGLRLLRLSPEGEIIQQWGGRGAAIGAGQPVDVAVASDGAIYLTEAERGLIWRLSPDGSAASWVAVANANTVDGPHVAVGPDGWVYVTDPERWRVIVYEPDGRPIAQFGQQGSEPGQFQKPVGIAVDALGRIYVADSVSCRVQAFAPIEARRRFNRNSQS
ncbi:MAG: PA14 domain-containing protein [Anaerolineae bacterium]|nr:PA14 domain-containing protein [Anaerolineae bacterium]MDW8099812.1 PA14 domain-containing protein [Anaerolineae bacterium]